MSSLMEKYESLKQQRYSIDGQINFAEKLYTLLKRMVESENEAELDFRRKVEQDPDQINTTLSAKAWFHKAAANALGTYGIELMREQLELYKIQKELTESMDSLVEEMERKAQR